MSARKPVDIQQFIDDTKQRGASGECFICQIAAGKLPHHMVYEDDKVLVFLNKFPTLYGYTLVAPRQHREEVSGDFSLEEYIALQQVIYHVAEAIREELTPERVYICSLGSQQGNKHVHWHIAPLPVGVPFEEQQFHAMMLEYGMLELSDEEMATIAQRLHARLEARLG